MSTVTMAHPNLPGRAIRVRAAAVPHYQASGWQVAPDVPTTPTKAARRRRQQGDES